MNFELTDEQQTIRATARDLLAHRDGQGLWPEMCSLGWPGIAVSEEYGGQALGLFELVLLAEELGYACAPTRFLGTTLAALTIELAGTDEQRARWLADLAAGTLSGAIAIAEHDALIPDASPDGLIVVIDPPAATNGALSHPADTSTPDWSSATVHERDAVQAVTAIDPRRDHARLIESRNGGEPLQGAIGHALDRAAVVVAAELLGLCRRALDLTVTYIKERRQFGVPIGSFQAVQHATAQMLRDVEVVASTTYYAAWAADADADALPQASAMAKALASDAGRSVTAAAIQLHGGIGFTWEAELHWLFKRAQVDSAYLGGAAHQRARAMRLLTARRQPASMTLA